MTKVAILGAAGRMGRALLHAMRQFPELELVAAVEFDGHAGIGRDAGILAGCGESGVPLTCDATAAIAAADVAVDFALHEALDGHVQAAAEAGTAMVIGTTGLDESEKAGLAAAAARVPIVWAPNMSLAMNVLFALTRRAAGILGTAYDAEIVETHHRHKKDAPSGTALHLGECVAGGRQQDLARVAVHGREGHTGERAEGEIGFHALRAGGVVGDHTVVLASEGERLELTHRASSRNAFAMGALRAVQWIEGREPALYDMQDVLGLR